jgi:hypothetical protein
VAGVLHGCAVFQRLGSPHHSRDIAIRKNKDLQRELLVRPCWMLTGRYSGFSHANYWRFFHEAHYFKNCATAQHSGLFPKGYAQAKQIPRQFLETLGLSTSISKGVKTLSIPYYDVDGGIINTRYRTARKGPDAFRWEKEDEVTPYGLGKLTEAKEAGFVVLVEGESDCHTLWYKKFPAIGIPGADAWQDDWGTRYLGDIPTIYAVIKPKACGESILEKLKKSPIRDRIRVVDLERHKNLNKFYCAAPNKFRGRFEKALKTAVPLRPIDMEAIKQIAQSKDILEVFTEDLRKCGIIGEENVCKLLYLCLSTRFFRDPVSVVVKGGSSGGKSYTNGGVLKFFPPDACMDLTSMSEKALVYSETSFKHRFLWIYEAAGLENPSVRYWIRTLLSEGRIKHLVTGNTAGRRASKTIKKEGPTGLILTTTLKFIGEDQENRLLSIPINVSPEQTRQILVGQAEEAVGEGNASNSGGVESAVDLSAWHELQEWLRQSDHRVVIPSAKALARLVNTSERRLEPLTKVAILRKNLIFNSV